jgi:hypothetical protein
MRAVFLALLCIVGASSLLAKEKPPVTYTIPLPPKPDFSALEWLLGAWAGKTTGRAPQGEVRLSVAYDLEKRVMVLREEVTFPATTAVPAAKEAWMGILSGDRSGAGFILWTFSDTGFITRYRVTAQEGEVTCNPEGGEQPPPEWLVRRVISRSGDAELTETVQMAPPKRAFFEYYSAKLTRTSSP